MRDMIYYPGFEVKNENWLKFALLYFDRLRPIIPLTTHSERNYLSEKFQYVMGETDLIRPYRPAYEEGSCASILACEEFEKYLLHPEIYGEYFRVDKAKELIEKWRNRVYQDCTLFNGKYSQTFFDFCIANEIATPCKEGIRISQDLAFVYMSFLADIISKQNEYEMITDVTKYSRYLINKDLTVSTKNQDRIKVAKNNIEFLLPDDISQIPLKEFVQLRKDTSFNSARKAYMEQIEKLILHHERDEYFSMEELLSYQMDLIGIGSKLFAFSCAATVSYYSFYEFYHDYHAATIPALASAVLEYNVVKDTYSNLKKYIDNIKGKRLARKYVAKINRVNMPIRKK